MPGNQIKIIDYRNARYQGQIKNDKFHGVGILLDDDFGFCLANWKENGLHGPMLAILPDEKIFYGEFTNDDYNGFCCYHMGAECQVYCLADKGQILNPVAAVFPLISCVIQLSLHSNDKLATNEQSIYENEQHKWELINFILKIEVPENYRNVRKFLKKKLIAVSPSLEESYGKDYCIGFKDGGLKAVISLPDFVVRELGIYNDNNILSGMGKKVINSERRVRQEGFYDEINGLERYQERPKHLKKRYRDFFRKSMNFQNKFISLKKLDEVQNYFNSLKGSITDNTTHRIAQQLIENPNPEIPRPVRISNKSTVQHKNDEMNLDRLKEELNKSINGRAKSKSPSVSPYKQMGEKPPAQLNYTSKSISNAILEEYSQPSHSRNNNNRPDQYYQRSPIENAGPSRSPTTARQQRQPQIYTPISYFRREQQVNRLNPQGMGTSPSRQRIPSNNLPDKIYSNIEVGKGSRRSPSKLDKISSLYDQESIKEDRQRAPQSGNGVYGRKDYHMRDDEDMYERKMGLAKPVSRKVQYENNSHRRNNDSSPVRASNYERSPVRPSNYERSPVRTAGRERGRNERAASFMPYYQ